MTIDALPSAGTVSRRDPLVDYASNLAEFAASLYDPSAETTGIEGLDGVDDAGASLVGLIANAAMGAFVIPSVMRRMRHGGPVPSSSILLGVVVGGLLGYWKPLPTTLVQGTALLLEI